MHRASLLRKHITDQQICCTLGMPFHQLVRPENANGFGNSKITCCCDDVCERQDGRYFAAHLQAWGTASDHHSWKVGSICDHLHESVLRSLAKLSGFGLEAQSDLADLIPELDRQRPQQLRSAATHCSHVSDLHCLQRSQGFEPARTLSKIQTRQAGSFASRITRPARD